MYDVLSWKMWSKVKSLFQTWAVPQARTLSTRFLEIRLQCQQKHMKIHVLQGTQDRLEKDFWMRNL